MKGPRDLIISVALRVINVLFKAELAVASCYGQLDSGPADAISPV
jgi:hypothetical protein